jgi:subtilisin family serine protease
MTTNSRRGLRLAGAGGLSALLILAVLVFFDRDPATPVTAPQTTAAAPVAPEQTAPKAQAQPLQPIAVTQGVRQDYIVQASSVELARNAVVKAGGVITGELEIIRAVGASLDESQLAALYENPVAGLRVYDDAAVTASAASVLPETYYPQEVGATNLHKGGLTGRGVTVAVIDSGLWREKGPLQKTSYGKDPRVLAQYDATTAKTNPSNFDDAFGHGTHISAIIANGAVASTGR